MILSPQLCVDDSGSEPTGKNFVLAGFVASAESWASFSDEWQSVLDENPRLEYFKMTEAARLKGQFDPRNGWNEALRDDRLISFTRTIRKHVNIRIHARIKHNDFNINLRSIPIPQRSLASDNPYIMLFHQIILALIVRHDIYDLGEPCDFIFDTQTGFSAGVIETWPSMVEKIKESSRPHLARFFSSPPMFRDEKCFLPLQAADLYSWQLRNYFDLGDSSGLIIPVNKILGQFVGIPAIERPYDKNELARLNKHLIKVGAHLAKENPTVPLISISDDKRKRKAARKKTKKDVSSKEKKPI